MSYLSLKWIHILSATLLFGTGLGTAFYKYWADLQGDVTELWKHHWNIVMEMCSSFTHNGTTYMKEATDDIHEATKWIRCISDG